MMKGLFLRNSSWMSRYSAARLAPSRSSTAAADFRVSSGMSQALRQARVLDLAVSELSGLLAKVPALECGSQ